VHRLRELLLWAGAALGLLAVAAGVAVTFFGFSFLVFRSGSMEPEIPTGGLALAHTVPADEIEAGDIVSVVAGNGDRITHRVVSSTLRGDEATLVLQGDANAAPDTELYVVTSAERVVASVPYGGYVIAHALTPPGLVAVACICLMLLMLGFSRADDEDDELDDEDGDGHDDAGSEDSDEPVAAGASGRHRAHRWAGRGAAGAAAVAAGALALTGTTGTLAAFTDNAAATSSATANKWFTCDAAAKALAGTPYFYWKLDEGTIVLNGQAADSSGNGRPGSYVGALSLTGQTRACGRDSGTAAQLNGISSYITTNATTATAGPNTFTLSMWFKTTTQRGGKLIGFGNARTGSSGQYDRHVYMANDGRLVFGVYPGAVREVVSPDDYDDGVWHQVVATLSSAGMRLYADGALVASRTDTTSAESYSGFWRVGYDNLNAWNNTPTSAFFAGTVDEVAVYQGTAATADDVAAAYRAGLPTP
jgi:signal peptidase I